MNNWIEFHPINGFSVKNMLPRNRRQLSQSNAPAVQTPMWFSSLARQWLWNVSAMDILTLFVITASMIYSLIAAFGAESCFASIIPFDPPWSLYRLANWVFFGFRLVLRRKAKLSRALSSHATDFWLSQKAWTCIVSHRLELDNCKSTNYIFRNTSGMQKLVSETKSGNGLEYGQVT